MEDCGFSAPKIVLTRGPEDGRDPVKIVAKLATYITYDQNRLEESTVSCGCVGCTGLAY